jgi:hypothetical protein
VPLTASGLLGSAALLLTPPTPSRSPAEVARAAWVGAAALSVTTDELSRSSGEIFSATAGAKRVRALMVLPNPSKESVKTAAASEIATATIASERFVQRRGEVVLPDIGMLASVHAPFHGIARTAEHSPIPSATVGRSNAEARLRLFAAFAG